MRKGLIFSSLICLAYLVACTDYTNEEIAKTDAYIKYFQESDENYGRDIKRLPDRTLLLLGVVYDGTARTTVLIKTDSWGNIESGWPQEYNNFDGKSLFVDASGYYIMGDGINGDASPTSMRLVQTDTQGLNATTIDFAPDSTSTDDYRGTAFYNEGEAIGLGYIEDSNGDLTEMRVGYDLQNGTIEWTIESNPDIDYRPGRAIYPSGSGHVWTTTRTQNSENNILVQFARSNQSPGKSNFVDGNVGVDMAPMLGGFVGIGNKGSDMVVYLTDADGNSQSETNLETGTAQAISSSSAGFVVVLGSVTATSRTDEDFRVIKMNATGDKFFDEEVGGSGDESGGGAVDMDDGGVAIFGTSDYNGVKSMILIKTNKEGTLKI